MKLIDIGINLMHRSFDKDRHLIVQAAGEAGVSPLIITGTNERGSLEALSYAAKYPGKLYATAGVHPHDAKTCGPATPRKLKDLARHECAVAIGECGLDYNRDFSPRDTQREWFIKQLELAAELAMPVFLHERDAFEDFFAILKERRAGIKNAVVHCFTGSEKELDAYLGLGCFIGITGWICDERRGRHLAGLVKRIPADRLMIETDAPFLMPRDLEDGGGKSGRNEPKYLTHIAEALARHLEKDVKVLAEETYTNSRLFFGIE
ncbi:MAG: TatD family hydrolase [Spirochaetales bacterium]|jgi:TatD DNase family protein|nr:TatD family hydrolase [Spirochaetales bacterium]